MSVLPRVLIVLSCVFLATGADLVAQRNLKSTQKRAVDRALKVVKDGSEEDRNAALRRIALYGDPLHAYLLKLGQEDASRSEVFRAIRELHRIEGRDLDSKAVGGKASPWTCWTFGTKEVLLMRGLAGFVALQVHGDYDPAAGTMTVTLAQSDSKVLPLGGPGVKRETRVLTGTEVVLEGRSSAFPVRDFVTKVMGSEIVLRSVGSEAFRYGLKPGTLAVARTGKDDMRRVRGGMKGLVFEDRPADDLAADCRRTQQYLFRLIDGMEPLPTYGTEDESTFAHAEQVQVSVRQERSGGRVLLVSFPHADETIAYDETTHGLLIAFVGRVFADTRVDLMVWIGKNEAHETNWFYTRGKWKVPRGAMRKRVVALFPEDY